MDLQLQLSDRKYDAIFSALRARRDEMVDERRQRLEFRPLDIDLEDVDEGVSILLHQRLERVRGLLGSFDVFSSEGVREEMRARFQVRVVLDFGAKRGDTEVVTP